MEDAGWTGDGFWRTSWEFSGKGGAACAAAKSSPAAIADRNFMVMDELWFLINLATLFDDEMFLASRGKFIPACGEIFTGFLPYDNFPQHTGSDSRLKFQARGR